MDSPARDSHNFQRERPENRSGANGSPVDSANLRSIKEAFRAFTEDGTSAGVEALLRVSHEHCGFRPHGAGERVLRGSEEIRASFSEASAAATSVSVRPRRFEARGDEVVVSGSIRVVRPGGGFAESQVCWVYRFRDGLVEEVSWGARHSHPSAG